MESNSTSLDFFESPGQLWHMYKNAKNLIAHKARIENLTWRMMYVKDQELLRNKFKIGNNHDIFPSVPLEQLNIFGSTMVTSEETQKEEEFEYIAHVRTMSNSQQTRKRPAPLSPFLAAIHEPELPDPVSIRSNLSAALKINPSQTSSANSNDNGYEFLLDPLAFEGPNQNFSDVRENPVEYTGQIDNFGSRSIQGSTFATRPTFAHSSSSNQQDFFTENPPIQSIQESSPFQKILDPQLSNMDPMEFHRNMNSSGIASSAPQTISMVQNQSRFPPSKRQTPSSSYDPVSFGYNPGSAFANGASISRSRNSLVNVADHFAPPSRPFTPYDDDTGYISDTMNLGNYQSDHNVLLSAKSSLVDLSFMGETDSEMTFFDTKARGPPVSLLSQQLNHQQSTSMQNPTTNTGVSWTDLDDSGSPGGLVLTANPGTTTNMIRLNSLSKKKNKHVKGKKKTDFSSFSGPTGKKAVQERKANAVGSRGGAKVNGKGGGGNANGNPTIECTNCYTKTTPLWRRNPQGEPLCNACGLFLKLHGTVRPLSLKTDVIKKRQRGQGPNALNKPSQPQKTNTKGSSQVPVIKPNRDGDDFNPRPINKTGTKEMSDSTRTNDTNLNEEKGEGVVSINSQDTLLTPNVLEKENEWYTMPPNDLSMDAEIHEKSKESWDWLSMNI